MRGAELLTAKLLPFALASFTSSDRVYVVRFLDKDGTEHQARCRTNFGRVLLASDEVVATDADETGDATSRDA